MDLKRQKVNVLGVDVDDIGQTRAVDDILKLASDKKTGHYVVTVNAEFVMMARKNKDFAKILNSADLAVADGQWVVWAKLILGGKAQERVTGVDIIERLCEKSAKKAVRIGFLGGFGNVAKVVSERQKAKNPGLKVVYADSGDPAIGYDLRLNQQLSAVGKVDILFVAYGMGRQEFWIERHRKKQRFSTKKPTFTAKNLDVGVFIGVGGALDMLSGVKKRAPKFVQNAGFEYLWRLALEPSRAGRMLKVFPLFWILVFRQKLFKKS